MKPLPRCINLDWLEVSVLEPVTQPHDPDYFRACGFVVHEREYGTRVWKQMFTIEGSDVYPFIEVRREPQSEIIAINVAHLRFVNRVCYFQHAARLMQEFIDAHHYEFHHIARVDICYDFERFDYGDDPRDFMQRFMMGKYSKINQANIHAHGSDEWAGRVWNSISWGSPSSDIGTKFYNKTLELYDPTTKSYGKPYIRQCWEACGLVDDATTLQKHKPDGTIYVPAIWRVEFSIRSSVRKWFTIRLNGHEKEIQSIRNTLDMYDTDEKLLVMFAALSEHYFHFKHLLKRFNFAQDGHTSGNPLRKDRCPDKLLFNWKCTQMTIKVERESVAGNEKPDTNLLRLLSALKAYREVTHETAIRNTCDILINHLTDKMHHADISNHSNRWDILALRQTLSSKLKGNTIDPALLLRMMQEDMKLRAQICPPF